MRTLCRYAHAVSFLSEDQEAGMTATLRIKIGCLFDWVVDNTVLHMFSPLVMPIIYRRRTDVYIDLDSPLGIKKEPYLSGSFL